MGRQSLLKIITAEERLATKQPCNIALFAPFGWGKTFQARTLDPTETLVIDLEAGTLALGDWAGPTLSVRAQAEAAGVHPWQLAQALACLIGGADPAAAPGSAYAADMLAQYEQVLGPRSQFDAFKNIFVDSITVASRNSFAWAQRQPEAFSEKTGKPDTRGAYGLMGREMVNWLTQLQHSQKSVVVVGILEAVKDDFGRIEYVPQMEGSKTGRELPGIFDQVITGGMFVIENGQPVLDFQKGTARGFICHQQNGYGVPAKDRSGKLDAIEAPDLGALLKKIQGGSRVDTPNYSAPAQSVG
jgi:hypothetical protein